MAIYIGIKPTNAKKLGRNWLGIGPVEADGTRWFHYGEGRGAKRFNTDPELVAEIRPWLAKRIKELGSTLAELSDILAALEGHG